MARCGLRMMPPFPSSPLSAVRRVFPSTAGRLACQAGPSQHVNQLKLAPGMHCSTSGLSSPFVHLVANIGYPVLSRAAGSIVHHQEAEYSATPEVLAPVRVVLSRSIITYSTSSAPLTGTSQFHRTAAYMRCLRCAGAPRRPASGSELSLLIPSWHAVLSDPGEFDIDIQNIRCRHWPSPIDHRLSTPDTPAIRFTRAVDFVASLVRFRYSLPGCSPPCTDQTGTPSLRGLLLPGFQRIGLPPRCWI